MKVGVIGMGVVGETTAKVLERFHSILSYDLYKKGYEDASSLKESEVVFICVPTPMMPSGRIDYSPIHNSLETLVRVTSQNEKRPLVAIRSTAVSGTTDKLEENYPFNFVFNPEFFRENHALEDMENINRIIIGANRIQDYEKIVSVYKPVYPNAKYIYVDRKTAEMIKYASNVMLTGQIAIANEIYQICKVIEVNYDIIKQNIIMDERIGKNIDVPGPDGNLGFGGKCFPKDLNALIYLAREHMYRPYLLEEIWRLNERVRGEKNWLNIPGAVSNKDSSNKHK